ncbi:ORF2 [Broome virga-like virus 1]|nr:ORF2 [Broome virga-like virus 1]
MRLLLLIIFTFIAGFNAYTTNPNSIKSICCQCRSRSLVCNFCTQYTDSHGCDLSGSELTTWAISVTTYFETNLVPTHTSGFASSYGYLYFLKNNLAPSFTAAAASCSRHSNTAQYLYGDSILNDFDCSSASVGSSCGVGRYCSQAITTTSGNTHYCFSQYAKLPSIEWYDINYYYNKVASPTGDCVEANYPSLLSAMKELSSPPPNSITIDAYDDISMQLTVRMTNHLYNTYRMLERGLPYAKRTYNSIETFCTNDPVITSRVFTSPQQMYTWYLNVLIIRRGPCSLYVPYTELQDICADDLLLSDYTASCPDSFRTRQFSPGQWTTYNITVPNPNSTCDNLKQIFDCGVRDWIDYYANITSGVGGGGSANYEEHARLTDEYAQARQFGWFSWISGVFEPGIKLIFDIFGQNFEDYVVTFFEKLLEYILQIVFELFNSIVALFKRSQQFINKLVDFITQILDVLFSFLAFLLKALIGVLLKIEQHYLFFEYVILFLVVDYYLINNNIFSLLVVILVMVVVGIDRRSPSILLAFHSPEYTYVNITGYDPSAFTWDYTLVYHSYSRNKTYNITLPPLPQLPDIPYYNTTSKVNITYPLYEIKNHTIDCDSYPLYNTTGYFIHQS